MIRIFHLARVDRVQAAGRLVQEDQFRVVDQGLGQADQAGHALGVFLQLAAAWPSPSPTISIRSATRWRRSARGMLNSRP